MREQIVPPNADDIVQLPPKGTEDGEASMKILLSDGQLIIEHGTRNLVLMKATIDKGFWDGLWAYMEQHSRVTYRYREN